MKFTSLAALTFLSALLASEAVAQLPDGPYDAQPQADTEPRQMRLSGWSISYRGSPPNCFEERTQTGPTYFTVEGRHSWPLHFYGNSTKPPLCMKNGSIAVRAPDTSTRGDTTWFRTYDPVNRTISGWTAPSIDPAGESAAGTCQPARRHEREYSYQQVFDLQTQQTTDDGYQSIDRSYEGDRVVRESTYTSRYEPRVWLPFTFEPSIWQGCTDDELVVWNTYTGVAVSGLSSGFAGAELRWREPSLSGTPPVLTLARSDGSGDIGTATYLGSAPASAGVQHRWRYLPPQRVGATISPNVTALISVDGSERTRVAFGLYVAPTVLVHGLWSDQSSLYALQKRLELRLPALASVELADYRAFNVHSFADPEVQNIVMAAVRRAISAASLRGIAADRVNIVGHSMGGLAGALYAYGAAPAGGDPAVDHLVTIGTPMLGSELAPWLIGLADANTPSCDALSGADVSTFWLPFALAECAVETTLAPLRPSTYLASRALTAGPALQALTAGSADLNFAHLALAAHPPTAIAGHADTSTLELLFPILSTFAGDLRSLDSLLGPTHDSIVSVPSQRAYGDGVTLPDHVHTTLLLGRRDLLGNIQETQSLAVADRVTCVLAGSPCGPVRVEATAATRVTATGADDIFTAIFAGRTRIAPSFAQVATVPALRQLQPATITLKSPSGCALERALWWPARQDFSYTPGSPFLVSFLPQRSGSQCTAVVGLCGGNRFFVVAAELSVGVPSAGKLAFRPTSVILEAGTETVVALTGGPPDDIDAYPQASLFSSVPGVAEVDAASARIRAKAPGSTLVRATLGSASADLLVSVVPALDTIFVDGFGLLAGASH